MKSHQPAKSAPFSRSEFLVAPLLVGLLACDKPAPREHVRPHADAPLAPANTNPDGGVAPGFVPSSPTAPDASTPDAGTDAGAVTSEPKCGRGPDTSLAFSKRALLQSVAQCAVREYCEFQGLAADFAAKASAHAKAPSDTSLMAAKNAWYFAMQKWQVAELFRFGPAAPTMEPAGQGLRDQIYAFPAQSRCTMEEQIVNESYLPENFSKVPFNARGLGAAEFLLFFEGTANACSQYSALNYPAPGKWAALEVAELKTRKLLYLDAVASDVEVRAKTLLEAWQATSGDFLGELSTAGHGSKVFATEQSGLNAVSNALFYVDKELKDWKLARPAGLMECTTACTGNAESLYARVGGANVRSNLSGFRLLFQGCGENNSGLGFEDWLRAIDMGAFADDILQALDDAEAAVADFDLDADLVQNPSKVEAVHAAIKKLTDLLKTEFVSALDLELPMTSEGDND